MKREIPAPVIGVVADVVAGSETHASLDSLFMYAGCPGDPPLGSKHVKALAWLRRVNTADHTQPLMVLGKIIASYMEAEVFPWASDEDFAKARKARLESVLAGSELQYVKGGKIAGAVGTPSRTLEEMIRARDLVSLNFEFERALTTVDGSPREAVSAACNILESFCKIYIHDEALEMPQKQDLQPVWNVVRKHLGLDPSVVAERDLQEILSGIFAVVSGIGALRTHASTAHGSGKRLYKLEPRHARLAVHASHTLVLFLLESWVRRRNV